jgi:hypothetical protein
LTVGGVVVVGVVGVGVVVPGVVGVGVVTGGGGLPPGPGVGVVELGVGGFACVGGRLVTTG